MDNYEEIKITTHAIERYVERLCRLGQPVPVHPSESIRRLLKDASLEEVDPVIYVKRTINNNFKEAEYYTANGWRFVISDGTLVTVERAKRHQN